jgi:hypothetical protein
MITRNQAGSRATYDFPSVWTFPASRAMTRSAGCLTCDDGDMSEPCTLSLDAPGTDLATVAGKPLRWARWRGRACRYRPVSRSPPGLIAIMCRMAQLRPSPSRWVVWTSLIGPLRTPPPSRLFVPSTGFRCLSDRRCRPFGVFRTGQSGRSTFVCDRRRLAGCVVCRSTRHFPDVAGADAVLDAVRRCDVHGRPR